MEKHTSPKPMNALPDQHYHGIGLVVFKFAKIERLVLHLLYGFAKVDRATGDLLSRTPGVQEALALIEDFAKLNEFEFDDDAHRKLSKNIVKLKEFRDMIAHGNFVSHPDDSSPCVMITKTRWKGQEAELTGHRKKAVVPQASPLPLDSLYKAVVVADGIISDIADIANHHSL